MQTHTTRKLFTVDDYYKMFDAGILRDNDRVELIEGEIIQVSAMGTRHAAAVRRVNAVFVPAFKEKALVAPQLPLRLNEFNEPEPDVALLKPQPDWYSTKHPGPADVFLVVEISDSSLAYDRDVKLPIYAAAQMSEVWIADLENALVHVYRDPSGWLYRTHLEFHRGDLLSCVAFPEVQVAVDDLLFSSSSQLT